MAESGWCISGLVTIKSWEANSQPGLDIRKRQQSLTQSSKVGKSRLLPISHKERYIKTLQSIQLIGWDESQRGFKKFLTQEGRL